MHMKSLKKYSFTLIELIVALIVIGIVVTSIPMILTTVSNNQQTNMQEKSFFNAYALVTLMQTQEWDENNTVDDNYYKVLTSENGDDELKCIRKGVVQLDNSSGANCATGDHNGTSTIGPDAGEDDVSKFDDIDDFNDYVTTVNDYNISVKVSYVNDKTDYTLKNISINGEEEKNNDSNVKFVELNVTDNSSKKIIAVLKYFSSNIGMVKIESRNE